MIGHVNTILSGFIIVLCLVFAYFIAFTDLMEDTLQGTKRTIFIAVMVGYAAFRTYRLIRTLQLQKNEHDEDENDA